MLLYLRCWFKKSSEPTIKDSSVDQICILKFAEQTSGKIGWRLHVVQINKQGRCKDYMPSRFRVTRWFLHAARSSYEQNKVRVTRYYLYWPYLIWSNIDESETVSGSYGDSVFSLNFCISLNNSSLYGDTVSAWIPVFHSTVPGHTVILCIAEFLYITIFYLHF